MKNIYILTDNKKKIFDRDKSIQKDDSTLIGENFLKPANMTNKQTFWVLIMLLMESQKLGNR